MQFKNIVIVSKQGAPHINIYVTKLADYLMSIGCMVFVDCSDNCEEFYKKGYAVIKLNEWLLESKSLSVNGTNVDNLDLIIAIGGDGTLLSIARTIVDHSIPVVGVNQGKLGFMTDIPSDEMIQIVEDIVVNLHYTAEERVLIHADIYREENNIYSAIALNDVVVSRGAIGNMIEFDMCIDSQFVLSQKSDGVIFSTPTGSTAYSLAAGGPIIHPHANVFSIIPICPQSLTNRPLVISDNSSIEFVLARENSTQIHFDGQECFDLQLNDRVVLRKYPKSFKLVHPVGYNYYRTLRKKLDWSKRVS